MSPNCLCGVFQVSGRLVSLVCLKTMILTKVFFGQNITVASLEAYMAS